MAYDDDLAERVRDALVDQDRVEERKMFGGLGFMVGGYMTVGVVKDELMARVGADGEDEALERPHARPMDFTGRPMTGFIFVAADGVATEEDVGPWVDRALAFVSTLPPKYEFANCGRFVRVTPCIRRQGLVVSSMRRARSASRSKFHPAVVRGAIPSGSRSAESHLVGPTKAPPARRIFLVQNGLRTVRLDEGEHARPGIF